MIDDTTSVVLRANADKSEQSGRPAAESLEALRRGGFLALRAPREHGGSWSGTEAAARCLTDLGRACPSTAWVAGTCLTSKNGAVTGGLGTAEVFADPHALWCGSGSPTGRGERVDGGVRVRGRWRMVSGCEDAVWAMLGLMVGEVFSLAVIPVADLAVERTWDVAGMRGTGSHTLVADDVMVPDGRITPMSPFTANDLVLYAMTVLAPCVGAALGALDVTREMFESDRKPFPSAYSRMVSHRAPGNGWPRRPI
ncbi:acyl-CoA dehydrogenase family protein [Amycolatopsis sulphurea]|uniref:hypothetical protein n=1 Tax=Amycolatopsis sulphurea TaxID=76022 RepID=UPI001FE3BAD3|nr:hypothetical protein [Amycolatopsis sulphurea]